MMKQGGGGMETRQPDDDIGQDRVDICDRLTKIVGLGQHWSNIADAKDRDGMRFQH